METLPLPITKMKVSKDRWLMTKIKYEEDLTIKDILQDMMNKTYEWINDRNDLEHVSDYDSFKNNFIQTFYEKIAYDSIFMSVSEEELFDLKYLEEINELFLSLKSLNDYYGLKLCDDNFMDYFEFIKHNVVIHEFSDDELSDEDEIH
uniref:Uncharacterized protein n=1 Tax=viral metagenome TaxID=1070528 RepID=A0A6C0FDW7_9ZZZZ|tara:strand:+ start:82 stop:525 length:444 start_codon:yes stop_codon:yes gene_type:complete